MSEQKPQRRQHAPVFGIFLLFLGVLFLLQNFNILPWGVWGILWRFWPVLIIIPGLSLLLKRWNSWLVSILVVVILCACVGLAIWQHGTLIPAEEGTETYSELLDKTEYTEVQLGFVAELA